MEVNARLFSGFIPVQNFMKVGCWVVSEQRERNIVVMVSLNVFSNLFRQASSMEVRPEN